VREYLVWLVAEARLEWFCLEDDDYYLSQLPDAQGELHSRVFPSSPPIRRTAPGRRHRQSPGRIYGARAAEEKTSGNQCQK
jgi:hypothetical protein